MSVICKLRWNDLRQHERCRSRSGDVSAIFRRVVFSLFITWAIVGNAQERTSENRQLISVGEQIELKQAARAAHRQADASKAKEHLAALRDLYRAEYVANPSWRGEYQWSRRLAEVAHEYLRVGRLEDAMRVLGEAADLDVPLRTGFDNGWASVAGGLNRRLPQLDSEERYDLLHVWSMPTDARRSIRVLEAFVPTVAPPSDFAKVLRERPRAESFAIANVGEVTGLFSSAWELVKAADESGKLRRLIGELEQLVGEKVTNADHILLLAGIVTARRRDEQLEAEITQWATRLASENRKRAKDSAYSTAWQYGYGNFEEGKVTEFTHFPLWTGGAWQFTKDRPDKRHGFIRLDRTGGHPGWKTDCVRRWVAPSKGSVDVSGTLQHPTKQGDGILGRIVSSSSGVDGEWIVRNDSQDTDVVSIKVDAGDTIDFVVNKIGATTTDSHIWVCELRFDAGDKQVTYNTVTDFMGPHEASTLSDAVLAAACLEQDWLQPSAERLLEKLIENTYDSDSWMNRPDAVDSPLLRPALRRAWATAVSRRSGRESKLLDDSGLQTWVATNDGTSAEYAAGYVRPSWLAHENRVMHLAGSGGDSLMFRYPLTGEFAFSLDTQAGGRPGTDGGVAYGGLQYLVDGCEQLLKISDLRDQIVQPCPHARVRGRTGGRYVGQPTFNRLALSVAGNRVSVLSNGKSVWSEERNLGGSPWLALHALGDRMPVFLGLEITGNPVVPREVRMSNGNSLHGWSEAFGSDRLPRVVPEDEGQENDGARVLEEGAVDQTNPNHFVPHVLASHFLAHPLPVPRAGGLPIDKNRTAIDYDWFAKDGVIHGARRQGADGAIAQSQLRYCRPLLDDESISYEFFYEPDQQEVHPTLGRIAFLIGPGGVRLHWITDGDREWTGLSEDNSVVVPFDRRGPKPLPLIEADWNRMTIAIDRDRATLMLNDQLIYQRKLDPQADRTFGLYHDACRSAAQVKNVVMRGDWPERLTPGQLGKLAAVDEAKRTAADRNTLSYLFQETYLSNSVIEVVRHAATLSDEERYDYLFDWVLPTKSHSSLRLAGKFSLLPVPPLAEQEPLGIASPLEFTTTDTNRLQSDVQLIAPAFDLAKVAKRLGRLDDLRKRLTSEVDDPRSEAASQVQAMLTLIAIAAEDFAAANADLEALATALDNSDVVNLADRWPEMLAAWLGMRHPQTHEAARDLVDVMHERVREGKLGESDAWKRHLATLAAAGQFQDELTAFGHTVLTEPLQQWRAVSHVSARSRGEGFPRSHWQRLPHRVDNVSAHDRDYLYFQSPLQGNFQVECDVASTFGRRESHLAYGGTFTRAWDSLSHFGAGSLREQSFGGTPTLFEPRLTHPGDWMRYRLAVADGRMQVYFNGRLVRDQVLSNDHDPWLAIRNHWERSGAVCDLRITGDPVIPETVELVTSSELAGWLPYFNEPVGAADADWRFDNGELIGPKRSDSFTIGKERLLHYHRPMLEDGTIEYEFYYEPGQSNVHPALDRLAFLLEPPGIRVHWATHGEYDETRDPANAVDEPNNRRGPDRLPLRLGDWNKVRLTLSGDTIALALNGQLVFERELESTNLRTFGLVHFANQTEARVRNIIWKGDWPKELPTISRQELADVAVVKTLSNKVPELKQVIDIDFAKQGIPRSLLGVQSSKNGKRDRDVVARPDGLHVSCPAPNEPTHRYYYLGNYFEVGGDFDVSASFEQLETKVVNSPGADGVVWLFAAFDNDRKDHVALLRKQYWSGECHFQSNHSWEANGGRRNLRKGTVHDGSAGVLRLSRRGEKVYCLFAEDEAGPFRVLDEFDVPPGNVLLDGLRLMVESHDKAVTNIVWKRLTVHAEKITKPKTEELAGEFKLDVNTPKARFVRVDLPNKRNVLMLAECEVFSNGKNIAIGKAARQSSVDWDAPAKLAVDGNKNGHFSLARSTTHTKYDLEPWWEVDLGKDYDVERILVWKRSDHGKERLHGFRVELLDNDRKRVWGNTDDPNEILGDLNKQRDKLATRFAHDFVKNNLTADRFRRWGGFGEWNADDKGYRVSAPGADNWTASGLMVQREFTGDFDIEAVFELLKADKPADGHNSGIYLQLTLPHERRTDVTLFLSLKDDGTREVIAELGLLGDDGKYTYPHLGNIPVKSVSKLRLARRGKRIYFLITSDDSDEYRVIAQQDLTDMALPRGSVRLMVHTGGADRETEVVWKKIAVRAENVEPD
jgi:hypothetical protein